MIILGIEHSNSEFKSNKMYFPDNLIVFDMKKNEMLKKEEGKSKEKVETAVLSTTAKVKARKDRKDPKEPETPVKSQGGDVEMSEEKKTEEKKSEEKKDEKMEVD